MAIYMAPSDYEFQDPFRRWDNHANEVMNRVQYEREMERRRQEYIMSTQMQPPPLPQPKVCMTQPPPQKGNVDKEEKLQNLIAYYYNRI